MLDTIVLVLNEDKYTILEPDYFEPSARWAIHSKLSIGSRSFITSKQNPTKLEFKRGIYKPRLTLTNRYGFKRRWEATLKIELSLPKLLFGNNFDELTPIDFEPVTDKLQKALRSMGVMVIPQDLENAPVSAIHYSKNIPLTDGATPHFLISRIKEANIKLSLDTNQTDYRNEGYNYKLHANSYEVAFYDKIKDLEASRTSEKRAEENDNALQISLFDTFKERRRLEVLRMEVRLNKRQKIKQLFHTLSIQSEPTYKNLFNPTVSQKILLYFLDEIEAKRPRLLDLKTNGPKALLSSLIINNPQMGPLKILQTFGLKQALDIATTRELRAMLGKCNPRSWYRLIAEAKKINLPATKSPLDIIREHLTRFEPLKLVDFQERLLNNDKY